MRRKLVAIGLASLSLGIAVACGSSEGSGFIDPNAGKDGSTDGQSSGPPIFTGDGGTSGSSGDPDGSLGTCDAGCAEGAHCKYDVCVPNLGSCTTNDTCPGDSYCDPSDKTCVPYGVPPGKINDPSCARGDAPGDVKPEVQCEWVGTPDAGDPTAAYVNVYTTPMVADLNLDGDPNKLQPSVVMTTWALDDSVGGERIGMIRVFDGRTCQEQMRIGGPDDPDKDNDRPGYGTQIAIGDLDGDVSATNPHGHPEIVALHRMPGAFNSDLTATKLSLIAYRVDSTTDPANPKLVRKWLGRNCATQETITFGSNSDNYGPNIWDVDDDGVPEVVLDKNVFDKDGCLVTPPPGQYETYIQHGAITTVADVDLDGQPDLVRADGVYGWDKGTKNWAKKPWFLSDPKQRHGHIAVVDLGRYSDIPGKDKTTSLPEVVVVSAQSPDATDPKTTGEIRVQTLTGATVFGPVPLYTTETDNGNTAFFGGHGGPPTASDFDGDGWPEFAAAANAYYTVYDPDCEGVGPEGGQGVGAAAARPGGKCDRPDYMKTKPGIDKGILWAQPSHDFSSSETGSSIFDFNGDKKSEAVYRDECYLRVYDGPTGNVLFSAPAASGTGQEFPVICDADGDFATEIVVVRATNSPNGGNGPNDCPLTDPLAPSGTGTPFEKKGGFEILRDPFDRWLASRPIWNQHAYSITNVNDNATIPKASEVKRNWEQTGLNNFRQNTQGQLSSIALADLTAQISDLSALCNNGAGSIPLTARVCNRGTNPVQDGVTIGFYSAPKGLASFDAAAGKLICSDQTKTLLGIGQCTNITCTGAVSTDVDVYVVTDPDGKVADCHPGNNNGASARVLCPVVH
ncbi:MAG: hypothetical protein U0270_13785 [Labilithrix sp.]